MRRWVGVFGVDSSPLTEVIAEPRLQWLGHVLRMAAHGLSSCVHFADDGKI